MSVFFWAGSCIIIIISSLFSITVWYLKHTSTHVAVAINQCHAFLPDHFSINFISASIIVKSTLINFQVNVIDCIQINFYYCLIIFHVYLFQRHLSDTEFEQLFQCTRSDFYRLPQWRRNELKRRARLF